MVEGTEGTEDTQRERITDGVAICDGTVIRRAGARLPWISLEPPSRPHVLGTRSGI
ncbi:hypothetical protein [Streptomyces sp. TS71-3]|uniref:hypothetical protein n=1 Tax=Streptomyces sp. TS71-3 TaxID=2733862 RepID=UPI001B002415|nr:hypothetical protein [Streptomyces sp. TS71-3]GHJ37094.1 hypothetical protein Sm713_27030 [Streptomyces sp. TS71-3]